MSLATLLFTGPGLPDHVLDYAIGWAKENEGSLQTLFIVPGDLPEEGYAFPSDLDEAEAITTAADAEKGLKEIIQEEIRFIEKRCKASHVPVQSEVMFSPPLQKVVGHIKSSEIVFIDKRSRNYSDEMSELPYSVSDILRSSSSQVVEVGEMDRYSDVFY